MGVAEELFTTRKSMGLFRVLHSMRNALPVLVKAAVSPGAFIINHGELPAPWASMVRNLLPLVDFRSKFALMVLEFAKVALPVTFISTALRVPVKLGLSTVAAPIMPGVMLEDVELMLAVRGY